MSKAVKVNGKFVLEETSVQRAKKEHSSDLAKVLKKLSEEDLRSILERILTRLEALEQFE